VSFCSVEIGEVLVLAIVLAPVSKGEPWLFLGHVRDVPDEGAGWGPGGIWGRVLLGQYALDEVDADTTKTQVQPSNVGEGDHDGNRVRSGRDEEKVSLWWTSYILESGIVTLYNGIKA